MFNIVYMDMVNICIVYNIGYMDMVNICIVYNIEYMGTVSNRDNMLCTITIDKLEKVIKKYSLHHLPLIYNKRQKKEAETA